MKDRIDETPAVDLADSRSFRHWTPVSLRFSDQDSMGHINNVAYAAYTEAGRIAFMSDALSATETSDADFMLVHIRIDYLRQMHYPGTADVGTRVLRIGNSSVTLGHSVFDRGRAMAKMQSVLVFVDMEGETAVPIPADLRAALEKDTATTDDRPE